MQNLEQAIRERAYHLWMADGCRDGNSDGYWLAAQRDLLTASLSASTRFAPAPAASEPVSSEASYPAKKARASAAPRKAKRRAA